MADVVDQVSGLRAAPVNPLQDRTFVTDAGCNTLSFRVRPEPEPAPGRLVVDDDVASTDMACTPEMQAQDEWLIGLLTGDPFFVLSRVALTLAGPGGTLTLFARP